MKFQIEKSALVAALGAASSAVSRANTIPILAMVKIKTVGDHIELTTSNMDMLATVRARAFLDADGEGVTCVDFDRLYSIARAMPDGADMTFDLPDGETRASVKAGRSNFKMGTLAPDAFPTMSEGALDAALPMERAALMRLLKLGSSCGSDDKMNAFMTATFIQGIGDTVRAASTNRHRVICVDVPSSAPNCFERGAMLAPAFVQSALAVLAASHGDDVEISFSQGKAVLTTPSAKLIGKTIDGSYPDIRRVIPKPRPSPISVDCDMLSGAITRTLIMADSKGSAITMDIESGSIGMRSRSQNASDEASEEVEAQYDGRPICITMNGNYLKDALSHVRTEGLTIDIGDRKDAILVRETGETDWFMVIMPHAGS